jgi:hypothetical protein
MRLLMMLLQLFLVYVSNVKNFCLHFFPQLIYPHPILATHGVTYCSTRSCLYHSLLWRACVTAHMRISFSTWMDWIPIGSREATSRWGKSDSTWVETWRIHYLICSPKWLVTSSQVVLMVACEVAGDICRTLSELLNRVGELAGWTVSASPMRAE